jgi:hypothetical protein
MQTTQTVRERSRNIIRRAQVRDPLLSTPGEWVNADTRVYIKDLV